MDVSSALASFYEGIAGDARIGATHISLYMAFFLKWAESGDGCVAFSSGEIMSLAKIASRATYHKCLRDLVEGGYIRYIPSCNPFLKSLVLLRVVIANPNKFI